MKDESFYPSALRCSALADDEIHLWLVDLDQPPKSLAELAVTLTVDEQERAARFRFPEHRNRFIVGRGLLRELLGAYLNQPAAALRFEQGAHGKPALVGAGAEVGIRIDPLPPTPSHRGEGGIVIDGSAKTPSPLAGEGWGGGDGRLRADLHFNLSHCGGRALYVVAHREVGVDLERLDRTVSYASLAERVCTAREWAAFQALPAGQLQPAFFACWTRKEAIAKALGGGLASGLRNLDVCCREDASPDGRASVRDGQGREWSVLNLEPASGWIGALAALGSDWRWRGWRWA